MTLFHWWQTPRHETRSPAPALPEIPQDRLVRRRFRFSGRVQDVGFRYEAQLLALRLGLTGWARNELDGSVTIELEGEGGRLLSFLRELQAVPRFRITGLETEVLPLLGAEKTFQILY